jgi:hypothetical protein
MASMRTPFRLGLIILALAGAICSRSAAASATGAANPCHADPKRVQALLTRAPSAIKMVVRSSQPNQAICDFILEQPDITYLHADMLANIERRQFGGHAEALSYVAAQSSGLPVSQRVRTADLTDRLFAHDDPDVVPVYAVHGATVVKLKLEEPQSAARRDPDWNYRVERTAMEAAGATIIPKPSVLEPEISGPRQPLTGIAAWFRDIFLSWAIVLGPIVIAMVFSATRYRKKSASAADPRLD